jgi:hypothetical protein
MSLMLAFGVVVAGCGAFSTKKKGQKARENDNALTGTWQNSCTKMDWLGFTYNQVTFKFSVLGDFEKTTSLYDNESCTSAIGSLSESGTYAALGDAAATPQAKDINFTISEAKISADTDQAIKLLNTGAYCGISDWQKGQATDVLDKPCVGFQHTKGKVIFDIYKVDQDNKRLETGKGSIFLDKGDADARPKDLDETNVFVKK